MAESALRIRFVFSQQAGDIFERPGRQRFSQKFAAGIVEDFAFRYAEKTYRDMASRIQDRLQRDIRRELRHMAALFQRHIIGAAPRSSYPSGYLDTLEPSYYGLGERVPIRASIPAWAARSRQYLTYKQRKIGHQRWWENKGDLSQAMNPDSWMAAFGPILVEFRRARNAAMRDSRGISQFPIQFGASQGHVKVVVGTLRVLALANITPHMLPALSSGDPTVMNTDQGNEGLMGLVRAGMGDEVAMRLGRRSTMESGARYRPTLEPFLAYFLTRSVPNAIANRIERGELGAVRAGGAGRTR